MHISKEVLSEFKTFYLHKLDGASNFSQAIFASDPKTKYITDWITNPGTRRICKRYKNCKLYLNCIFKLLHNYTKLCRKRI
jgi:hypothetical protein